MQVKKFLDILVVLMLQLPFVYKRFVRRCGLGSTAIDMQICYASAGRPAAPGIWRCLKSVKAPSDFFILTDRMELHKRFLQVLQQIRPQPAESGAVEMRPTAR